MGITRSEIVVAAVHAPPRIFVITNTERPVRVDYARKSHSGNRYSLIGAYQHGNKKANVER